VRASGAVADDTPTFSSCYQSIHACLCHQLWSFLCSPSPSAFTLIPCSVLQYSSIPLCIAMRLVGVAWVYLPGLLSFTVSKRGHLFPMNRASQRPIAVPASSSGVINDIFHAVARSCDAHLAFLVFPWNSSFDRLHVSFTFIHASLVT
jgi:hypothetical protein